MQYLRGTLRALLAQQSGQIQLLIIAPILTLSVLSLVVRSANSAIDPAAEKRKVAEQLKRRLNEVQNEVQSLQETPEKLPLEDEDTQAPQADEATHSPVSHLWPDLSHSLPSSFQVTYRIRKNDTLETILKGEGLVPEEIADWIAAARTAKELRHLQISRTLTFVFDEGEDGPLLKALSYELDQQSWLVLERQTDGRIASRRETLPSTLVWRAVGGRIESSLYNAAIRAGVPVRIVDELADMSWDLDFSSDLRSGDTFKVIFEEIQRDGQPVEYGRTLAAQIVNKGKVSTLFADFRQGQQPGLQAAGRGFLRYPLRFTRISSVFTHARFHPILKRRRPHWGVDFAAPPGTPVRAVADGTIMHAGWKGQFGKLVRIDHPGPYGSEYAHLQRVARGVRRGIKVRRGRVIGYVGSTGLATGPHLHFALYKNGEYVNPLTAKLPRSNRPSTQNEQDPVVAKTKKKLGEYLAALEIDRQSATLVLAAVQDSATARRKTAEPQT